MSINRFLELHSILEDPKSISCWHHTDIIKKHTDFGSILQQIHKISSSVVFFSSPNLQQKIISKRIKSGFGDLSMTSTSPSNWPSAQTSWETFVPTKTHVTSEVLSPPELRRPQVTTSPFSKRAANAWEVDWMCFTSFLRYKQTDVNQGLLSEEHVTTLRMEGHTLHHWKDVSRDVSTTLRIFCWMPTP